MSLKLEDVEATIDMVLHTHMDSVNNYIEHVNSLLIPPPKNTAIRPSEWDERGMSLAKGMATGYTLVHRIRGEDVPRSTVCLLVFLVSYCKTREGTEDAFGNIDAATWDPMTQGMGDLSAEVCQKVAEVLESRVGEMISFVVGQPLDDTTVSVSWVTGKRIAQYLNDGDALAASLSISVEEEGPNNG